MLGKAEKALDAAKAKVSAIKNQKLLGPVKAAAARLDQARGEAVTVQNDITTKANAVDRAEAALFADLKAAGLPGPAAAVKARSDILDQHGKTLAAMEKHEADCRGVSQAGRDLIVLYQAAIDAGCAGRAWENAREVQLIASQNLGQATFVAAWGDGQVRLLPAERESLTDALKKWDEIVQVVQDAFKGVMR